jgi:hypothetical protein
MMIARSRRPQANTGPEFEATSFGVGSYSLLIDAEWQLSGKHAVGARTAGDPTYLTPHCPPDNISLARAASLCICSISSRAPPNFSSLRNLAINST